MTPIYSPLTSESSNNNDSEKTQISHELGNFITIQQQSLHPQTVTIRQLSQSIISSNPSTPTPSSIYTLHKTRLPHQPHPLVQTALTEPLKENSQILHSHLTQEHPEHLSIIHFTLTPKNFSKYLYPFSHNTHTSIQTPMKRKLIITPHNNLIMQHPTLSSNNSANTKTIHTDRIQTIINQIHRTKN